MKFSAKNFFLIGILVVILITIPLTLYFVKKQQELRSKAAPSSNLSLVASKSTLNVGDTIDVDLMLDPGQNIPSFIKFALTYDPTKIEITKIEPDPTNITTTLSGPTISEGSASAELGINKVISGYDPTQSLGQQIKVATLKITAKEVTDTPTQISFDYPGSTQVLSIATSDGPGENVLANATPLSLTILSGGDITPSPSISPTITITPSPSPTTAPNSSPICTSLTATPATGSAPLSTSFTAVGSDTDGTIAKASFSFGDGSVVDVTSGLSTQSVTVQQSHTYSAANSYQATVFLTDDKGATSELCNSSVTVSTGGSGGVVTPTPTTAEVAPTTPPVTAAPTAAPTLPPTGSLGVTIGVVSGIVLTVLGGLVLFVL
jgi:hypothetical protein